MLNVPGSNGFCGFRYEPQMNADRRSRPVQAIRVREYQRSSAVCRDHSCLKSYAATKSVRIRNVPLEIRFSDYPRFYNSQV